MGAVVLICIDALKTSWRQSSEFMAHRHGRLGALRRGAGALLEALVCTAAASNGRSATMWAGAAGPRSIFVLRNNDLGDVLVSTPLFEALRRRFPEARITAGVGAWAAPILENNPFVDSVLTMNAPWYNKFVADRSLCAAASYALCSESAKELRRQRFDLGIDVLGSHFGALLLLRAKIPCRLGVRGYAGGHTACDRAIDYDNDVHVSRFVLRFAQLLGDGPLPPPRPQLFLTPAERHQGEQLWREPRGDSLRIVIGSGNGSLGKYWPLPHFREAARLLGRQGGVKVALVGGVGDVDACQSVADECPGALNHCGILSLRQTFSLLASADAVLCNSSMLMHAAAAFGIATVVVLGQSYPSAEQHAALWGYPHNCLVLGKGRDRDEIASPAEAVNALLASAHWRDPHDCGGAMEGALVSPRAALAGIDS